MSAFDNLPRASFSGAEFPVESVRVKGGLRYHVHEYPHIDGGDLEKLGRRLYEIEMRAQFHSISNADGTAGFGTWGPIWPSRLTLLRALFDARTTATLVVPSIGSIRACCIDWDQEMVAKVRSGEPATFRFIEDQETAFAFAKLFSLDLNTLDRKVEMVSIQFDKVGIARSLTDQLVDAVDAALAIIDQVELAQLQVAAKIALVASLCREFDKRITELQQPENFRALDAMKDLWLAAQQLASNADASGVTFSAFLVRRAMSITDVAIAIYGDSSRSVELLQLNPIEDPFNIPPGTSVRYVVPTTQQVAA
jgi:prophage DNA circulation protein